MSRGAGRDRRPIHWTATADLDLEGVDPESLRWDAGQRCFRSPSTTFRPAAVLPLPDPDGVACSDWLTRVPDTLGSELVLLMQAGAVAYGLWEDDELVLHRAEKRYVIRGNGRAQPTYLESRGKSRYGSRLRLQNAKALASGTVDDLTAWTDERGPFDRAFVSCPVRLWSDFTSQRPAPPLDDVDVVRVPLDVDVPTHAELLRVRAWLTEGVLEIESAD